MKPLSELRCEVCGNPDWFACAPGHEAERVGDLFAVTREVPPSALCRACFVSRFGDWSGVKEAEAKR